MASQLTRDDVAHIARLARLELSAAELDVLSVQLRDILTYAETIQKVDTSAIDASDQSPMPAGVWRDDAPAPSVGRDEVVGQAPDAARDAGLFRVPKVM